MKDEHLEILSGFCLDAKPVICEKYGNGHINHTFLCVTETGKRYILQRINSETFKNVPALMDNIVRVTAHLRAKTADPRGVVNLIPTKNGAYFCEKNGFWRVYEFAESTVCLQKPQSDSDFYESAVAFGSFQKKLADFPAETLYESIPDFHNTPKRYEAFDKAVRDDVCGRAKEVLREIEFYSLRREEASVLQRMREKNELPTRVTHNDTKLNNVLLDEKTRRALCVIDLDTVMPGLSLYDFGDSIRFGASTGAEDERDLSKVSFSMRLFRVYTRGYLGACSLNDTETEMLPEGAKIMTLECGLRFLTDYLNGDKYFSVSREKHNLDRTRTQIKLVSDMENRWSDMKKAVREEAM